MCIKFTTFWKTGWVSWPNYFRNYCFRKILLPKRLEGLASEHHSVINVLTGSKHRWKMQGTTIILFSYEFHVKSVGKRSFTVIINLKTVCQHIDRRWQVFFPQYAEFSATTSNAFISKTQDFFLIFYCISEICIKFRTFAKKGRVS